MIIVRFQGGLGNQICQYEMYKTLQRRYPHETVKADLSLYSYDPSDPYSLELTFENISIKKATRKEIYKVSKQIPLIGFEKYCKEGASFNRGLRKLSFLINKVITRVNCRIANKASLEKCTIYQDYSDYTKLDERLFHIPPNKDMYINGTWYNYVFKDEKNDILKSLKFWGIEKSDNKNKELLELINQTNSVSIHIRRGNYVTLGYLLIDEKYYQAGIEYILSRVEKPHFFVFSNDMEFSRNLFKDYDQRMFTFVEGNSGLRSFRDMQLMAACKNNIIANSTFSLAATFLNHNSNITIVPKYWTKGGVKTWKNEGWIYI